MLTDPGRTAGLLVRPALEGVVERRQVIVSRRGGDEPVGEPRVLGKQRAVQVGPDHLVAAHALRTTGAVVAVALEHAAQGLRAGTEAGAAAVVLEAGQHLGTVIPEAGEVDLDRDVADEPRAVLAHRADVDEPQAGDALVAELVAVAEQLVAAAD